MSFKKIKDPERDKQITEPVYPAGDVNPIDTIAIMKMADDARQKKLEETPRLEEFENIVI